MIKVMNLKTKQKNKLKIKSRNKSRYLVIIYKLK